MASPVGPVRPRRGLWLLGRGGHRAHQGAPAVAVVLVVRFRMIVVAMDLS